MTAAKPKRKTKPAKKGEQPEGTQARARARGPNPEAWALFCAGVAEGKVERIAAMPTGYPYATLRGWMTHHPELREQLLDARAVEIQRRLDRMEHTPMTMGGEDGMPDKAAELLMKHDRWRLEGLDPEAFIPSRRVETTGKGGGPLQEEIKITIAEAIEWAQENDE